MPNAVAAGLRSRGIDVTTTDEAGLRSMADAEHLSFAASHGRVLVTRDADFLRLAPREAHAGIVYWNPKHRNLGSVVLSLALLWRNASQEELVGRVEYL